MAGEKMFAFLHNHREDRGAIANLRCALIESKRHRAWPLLGRIGGIGTDHKSRAVAAIAGYYATHPPAADEQPQGNLGDLCRKLLDNDERVKLDKADGVGPISRRFQHLLAADGEEVFDRVLRFVLRAKAEGIPINYERLYRDLLDWEYYPDRVRVRWARSFWAPQTQEVDGEATT